MVQYKVKRCSRQFCDTKEARVCLQSHLNKSKCSLITNLITNDYLQNEVPGVEYFIKMDPDFLLQIVELYLSYAPSEVSNLLWCYLVSYGVIRLNMSAIFDFQVRGPALYL